MPLIVVFDKTVTTIQVRAEKTGKCMKFEYKENDSRRSSEDKITSSNKFESTQNFKGRLSQIVCKQFFKV